ncbi:MAG TPA: response regulator transcription factor [Stackebrandtia sp.]|jgi:DNA-binding NarL/FixJ family response regulator|uniref:response regulator transcription factor n=1 Tax=Stackebrandtia sp. TaxID=2023065 RepID=UPI002D46AB6A|nr:response regulator transcription factor [Stackebrandtia sp.]HZE42025.1 response regulator transcription factor [Stackebrandtia sp.]
MTIKVLIADDQNVVRSGFRMIIDAREDLSVVGEAPDGDEAVRMVEATRPDVVLMDVRMPNVDGVEATRRITAAERPPQVVMLTSFDSDESLYESLRAGASGFLLKDVPAEGLVEAIRVVARGEALLAPVVTRRLLDQFVPTMKRRRRPASLSALTGRETDVLRFAARGESNAEIAVRLEVAAATVKTHMSAVLRKLDVSNRTQAVVIAYDSGLVRPGDSA